MGTQIPLLNLCDFQLKEIKEDKKRIRYKTPTYTKSYKFCHINPLTNELQYDGDERHIFRVKNLQLIYSLIYDYTGVNPFERADKIEMDGLTVYLEDMQAEIKGTEMLSIKERLKVHIKLLRLLKMKVNTALAIRVAKYYLKKGGCVGKF